MTSTLAICILTSFAFGTATWGQPIEPKPAFEGQTKAPAAPRSAPFETQVVTEKLNTSVVAGFFARWQFSGD